MIKKQTIEDRLAHIEALLTSQKTVLNFEEVAEYTGLSRSFLYKLTCSGGIPCYKPHGKVLYFSKVEIDAWMLSNKTKSRATIDQEASTYVALNK